MKVRTWVSHLRAAVCSTLLSFMISPSLGAEPVIAVLMSDESAPYQAMLEGFQDYLRSEGMQASYRVEYTAVSDGKVKRDSGTIKLQDAVLLYCIGTAACQDAMQQDVNRPVVASLVLNSEAIAGHAQATGVYLSYAPETQLQWLKKLFPEFRRVGVVYNKEQNQQLIDRTSLAAKKMGLELFAAPIYAPKEIPGALKELMRDIDILWALPDSMVLAPQSAKEILLTSFRNRIPVIGASAPWVKSGALYALDWDYTDMGAQAATMALQIIKGSPVSNVPASEPRSVAYTLNLKTAKHMKLDMPAELTRGAKHIYD